MTTLRGAVQGTRQRPPRDAVAPQEFAPQNGPYRAPDNRIVGRAGASIGLMVDTGHGPRSGDRVQAERSHRDATPVVGTLNLRFVPARNVVHVSVILENGRSVSVDPASIKVISAGAVPIEELEAGDPVVTDPGWRSVIDLDEARSEGLVREVIRDGLSWNDLFERMRRVLKPLVDAGWVASQEDIDEAEEDCVVCFLERDGDRLSVDHYPDGWTHIWITDDEGFSVEDAEPISVFPGHDAESIGIELGWIEPDRGQGS